MEITAKLNYLRIAPRKVRLAANLIRGKSVKKSQEILRFVIKKPSEPLLKLLNQAVSNAKNNFQLDENNLYVSKIIVNEGPKLKRWRARSRGQSYEIQKKTSHIVIILDEKMETEKKIEKPKASAKKNIINENLKEKKAKTKEKTPVVEISTKDVKNKVMKRAKSTGTVVSPRENKKTK